MSLKQRIQYKRNLKNQFRQPESPQQPQTELDNLFLSTNKLLNINRNTPLRPKKSMGSELDAGSE
jgi:spore coat protein CotF